MGHTYKLQNGNSNRTSLTRQLSILSGSNSSWQWRTPNSGPNSAYLGTKVWATYLRGNYNNNESSYIVPPTINLSNLGSPITLNWMQYAITEANLDFIYVDFIFCQFILAF